LAPLIYSGLHLSSEDIDIDVLYIAGECEETQQLVKFYIPKRLSKIQKSITSTISRSVEVGYGGSGVITASIALFKAVGVAIESIVRKFKKGRRVLVVVNEVRADSEEYLLSFRG